MDQDINYCCQHCSHPFYGMENGYFVTGKVEVIVCSLWCLVDWIAAWNNVPPSEWIPNET